MNATRRGSKFQRSWHGRLAGCTAFALLTAGGLARAAPGDLDASFGSNGVVRYRYDPKEMTSPEGPFVISGGLIQQTDGRLAFGLAVHWDGFLAVLSRTQTEDFVVLRFNQDGSPDLSFDGDGRTGPDFPGVAGTTAALLQQADGKLVAAGAGLTVRANTNFYGIGLVRYNVDGSPDTYFGQGGLAFFELGWQLAPEQRVVQQLHVIEQADGRLVVGSTAVSSGVDSGNIALARFNTDGTLDRTFGTHGQVIVDLTGTGRADYLLGLIHGPGGNIIVAGVTDFASGRSYAVMRLGQDGAPDPSFGLDSRTVVSFPDGASVVRGGTLAIQPDGKTLIAGGVTRLGESNANPDTEVVAVRLNANGGLDATFGSVGVARISETHFAAAQSVALEPSGAIIVGFTAAEPPYNASSVGDVRVARLTPSGELDRSYGSTGIAIVAVGIGPRTVDTILNMQLVKQTDGQVTVVYDDLDWTDDTVGHGAARLLAGGRHPGLLGLKAADAIRITEDAGSIAIPVRRTGGTFGAVTVDYATASDTATSGADFTETSGTLSWADGDVAEKTIVVAIAADNNFEGPESFKLSLSNPTGGTSLATSEIQIRIAGSTPISSSTPNTPQSPAGTSSSSGGGAIGWELLIALGLLLAARVSRARRSAETHARVA